MTINNAYSRSSIFILVVILVFACSGSSEKQVETQKSVEQANNDAESLKNLPRMLDLGSIHCKACKMMDPILDSLQIAYRGKAEIIFIDVREDNESARKYGITMIPTQIFFDSRGNEVYRHIGFFPADSIAAHLEQSGAKL